MPMQNLLDVTEVDEYQIRIPHGQIPGIYAHLRWEFPILSSKYYTRVARSGM